LIASGRFRIRDLARAQAGALTAENGSSELHGAVFVLTLPTYR
jgi:hypothetical protein